MSRPIRDIDDLKGADRAQRNRMALDRSLRSKDAFGRLHVEQCNIGKATVSPYFGREIPNHARLGLHPDMVYNLYRDPAELAKAANTFDNIPVLIRHVAVSAGKPEQDLVVGTTGSDTVYEHPFLKSSLSVWTQEAIDLIETMEQRELSPGYLYTADMTAGISPDGLPYHGVMRNIVGNHVATVRQGRQGPDVVVADSLPLELPPMRFPKFIAGLVSLLATAPTVEQQLALDGAIAEDLLAHDKAHGLTADEMKAACDSFSKKMGKAMDALTEAERDEAYKCAAADKAKPAMDAITPEALAAAVAAAKAEGVAEAQATAVKLAQDEQIAKDATIAAKLKGDADLTAARTAVAEVCGDVTCDSAAGVYEFAFKHLKHDVTGIPSAAYPQVFALVSKLQAAAPLPVASTIAADAQIAFPALANIRKG